MTKKVFITILTILVLTIAVGGFGYYLQSRNNADLTQNDTEKKQEQNQQMNAEKEKEKQNQEKQKNENNKELDFEKIDTSNWKEYCNKEYGFCVKYPESFIQKNGNNIDGNKGVTYLTEHKYAYFYSKSDSDEKSLNCPSIYAGFFNLPKSVKTFDGLLVAKNEYNGELLPKYKWKNGKETHINRKKWLISDLSPDFLMALTIKGDKYYVVEIGDDIGGPTITEKCENIFFGFLNTFRFLR